MIPAVDVWDGRVVRLERGRYDRVTVYADDPAAEAVRWLVQGAPLVHVVDLAGARHGRPDPALWRRLTAAGAVFQVGGGVRTVADVEAAVAAGAARVVIGTAAVWQPAAVAAMLAAVGAERIVAAIDVRRGRATGAGWEDEGRRLADVVAELAAAGVRRALVTGIARDGMMSGPDVGLLRAVADVAPDMALIGSGGVGDLADLRELARSGAEAAIVGRALYENRFGLAEAIAAAAREA